MLFPTQIQQSLVPFWQQHITPTLGLKEARQFVNATQKPKTWFAETVIKPRLFQPDTFGGVYYPVDLTKFSEGRNHFFAELLSADPDPNTTYGADPWIGLTLFANPLRLALPTDVGEDQQAKEAVQADAPKDRVVLGEHHVLTYEFDVSDTQFLKTQLSWLRPRKNPLDCPMGDLYRHCSGFADFSGITVNYSGNKSLHIHVVFATALARTRLGLHQCRSADLRRGFADHWERLHEDVLRILSTGSYRADEHLRFAESFRRLPNGSRVIEKGHLLGFPEGVVVPQVTLWEHNRERASRDELPLFWTPEPFHAMPKSVSPRTTYAARRKLGSDLTSDEQNYCETKLLGWYSDWPRFDHLTHEGGRWVAKFRNSEADRNPSSIMREDYSTIQIVGRDGDGLKPKSLRFPLGEMLRLWCGQMARKNGDNEDAIHLDDVLIEPSAGRVPHALEKQFQNSVRDCCAARSQMESFFRTTVATTPLLLVVGPEGIGKTSVLMALHHEIVADLDRRGESSLAMYAFADYETAEAKCATFNSIQGKNGFTGVVLPSFSRAYEEECERLGVAVISIEEAARRKFQSRWDAIERLQPQVIERFRSRHEALWAEIGEKSPVFFVVHQVAHDWKKNTLSRLMWSPSFWSQSNGDAPDYLNTLRRETTLGLAVHDEVKVESFVDLQPEEVVRWVESLVNSDLDLWRAEKPSLPKLLTSYQAFVAEKGYPVIDGRVKLLGFEDVRRIAELGFCKWDHVVSKDTGEYGCRASANDNGGEEEEARTHRDIYGERHGRDWEVASRGWWHGLANRIVVLTTEAVPTAVAPTADPDWTVFELEAPLAPRDLVNVYPSRFVRGDNLPALCQEFRDEHSGENWLIISNKVGMMTDTMTHASARGSNDLIGKNVVQTMTWMTPDDYERLQALNAWTGRSDLVGLRHIDEFNQSAGRNLGFRRQGDVKHVLLVNRRLLDVLLEHRAGVLGRTRYGLRLLLDRNQRYEATGRGRTGANAA